MRLPCDHTDEPVLLRFGEEAVGLFRNHDFHALAESFGYARAFDRELATAIETDLNSCVSEYKGNRVPFSQATHQITVKYFKPNSANLIALVECLFQLAADFNVLAELIVSSKGEERHLWLEDISAA